MNAFFQELFHAGIYKRTQGRIARQLTWVAMAVIVGLGLWQLSGTLEGWDPGWRREIRAQHAGVVKFSLNNEIVIVDPQGKELERHKPSGNPKKSVKQDEEVEPGTVLAEYNPLSDAWLRAALCFGVPGLLLVAGLWIAYRIVNVPTFADFLIAVEAEMNKVSWPSRSELFRALMVVLFTIFFLAAVLFSFDSFWRWFFDFLGIFPAKQPAEAAMASFELLWRALSNVIPSVS